jgi:hypothetical protein
MQKQRWVLVGVLVVTTALPTITRDLRASLNELEGPVKAYTSDHPTEVTE